MTLTLEREITNEPLTWWVSPHLITFDEWLETGSPKDFRELVDGALVERPMVQLEHEKLEVWLSRTVGVYIEERDLGILLGSRSPVAVNEFRGRMPDLFFVRKDRLGVVEQKATREAPDLILEIVSPNDRPSELRALETDYRNIGVPEIVFLDQPRRKVRTLRRDEQGKYGEETLTTGSLTLAALGSLALPLTWLFDEPRPNTRGTVAQWLGETSGDTKE